MGLNGRNSRASKELTSGLKPGLKTASSSGFTMTSSIIFGVLVVVLRNVIIFVK